MKTIEKKKNFISKLPTIFKILIILIILGLGYFGYTKFFKQSTAKTTYQTSKVQKGTLISTVSTTGQVSSVSNAQVITQITGTVTKLYVKNGDIVRNGQAILEISMDQASKQKYVQALSSYQSASNSLQNAKTSLYQLRTDMIAAESNFVAKAINKNKDRESDTYRELNNTKKSVEAKYNNQENVIKQTETALNSAWLNLQQLSPVVYAPASGEISGLSFQIGAAVNNTNATNPSATQATQTKIANIRTSNVPTALFDLSEIDVPNVKLGDKATITLDAFSDKTYTGKVSSIDTQGASSSGVTSYPTTITFDVEAPEVYPNMSASANIIINTKNDVLYVPTSAVQNQNGQSVVRILNNGAPEYIPVETGISSDNDIEIVNGLTEGQEVITAVINASTGSGSTTTSSSPFGIRTGGFGGGGNFRTPGR